MFLRDDAWGRECGPIVLGLPTPDRVGRAGHGQNAGQRLQGQTKRLTFKEGRLRLPTGTTRLESQAFRLLRAGRWFWP